MKIGLPQGKMTRPIFRHSCLQRLAEVITFRRILAERLPSSIFLRFSTVNDVSTVLDCVRRTYKAPYDELEETAARHRVLQNGRGEGSVGFTGRKRRREEDESVRNAFLEGANPLAEAISTLHTSPTSATSALGSDTMLETTNLIEDYYRLLVMLRDENSESDEANYIEILEPQVRLAKERIRFSHKMEEEMCSSRRFE
jgi:hypothetical protein